MISMGRLIGAMTAGATVFVGIIGIFYVITGGSAWMMLSIPLTLGATVSVMWRILTPLDDEERDRG